jgi:enoyl-CoA hydratase
MGLVSVERRDGAAVMRYANPPLGTMTAVGAQEMLEAFRPLSADAAVRCVIITGGLPDIFIRHYDVGELSDMSDAAETAPPPPPPQPGARPKQGFLALVDEIAEAPKPVVAAINGLCMGGGFELSLACDLRIASPAATAIGLPETRVGIFPGGGGTQRLARLIGPSRAKDLIYTGRFVDAQEALAIGLVDEVVPADEVYARSVEYVSQFTSGPALAYAAAKKAIDGGLDTDLRTGLDIESELFAGVFATDDAAIGMKSFVENGPGKASFTGR